MLGDLVYGYRQLLHQARRGQSSWLPPTGMQTGHLSKLSLARPVMCTGPSSWISWHAWGPVPGTQRGNAARPVGCMMRRHPACLKQSGTAMAWRPSAVRLTTAGTLRTRTSCPARACKRKPMPTAWFMRPTTMSCLQGTQMAVSTLASGLDLVGKCIPIGRSGLPCLTCTLKSCGGRWHSRRAAAPVSFTRPACLPTYLRYGHLQHRRIWDAWPATAVAFSHAPRRLFWEWQVHVDHSTSGTVLSGHNQGTGSRPGILQSYAAGLQGTDQASPLPCGAAGWG